jgi:flagellar protein FlaG
MISNLSQVIPATTSTVREPVSSSVQGATAAGNPSAASAAAVTAAQAGGTEQALAVAVDMLNSKIQNLNRNLEFTLDQGSGELVVKVVDAQTHEVIRQIPSKEAMAMAQNIDQYLQDHRMGLVQTKA